MESPWRAVTVEWRGAMAFIGRNPSGGSVQMGTINDQPGISPMELILAGLAGCTGVDIVMILEKKRQPLQAFEVRARGKRADDAPRVYTEFEVEYILWGNLDVKAVEQAIQLSEEKYCSVGAMLRKAAPIRSSYRILKVGETLEQIA
jgi:putative redox protein